VRLLFGNGLLGAPDHQRGKLGQLAGDAQLPGEILRWNFQRLGGGEMSDFFYDPHTGRLVEYLRDAWLVLPVPRYSPSHRQRVTSPPKY
jgi:hypothetical protein